MDEKISWKEANELYKQKYPDPEKRAVVKELHDLLVDMAKRDIERERMEELVIESLTKGKQAYSSPMTWYQWGSEEDLYEHLGNSVCMPGCHIWLLDDTSDHESFTCVFCKTDLYPRLPFPYTGKEHLRPLREDDIGSYHCLERFNDRNPHYPKWKHIYSW